MMEKEQGPTRPIMPKEAFDAKGKLRTNHEMPEGDIFYGSDEEYTEEVTSRKEK